MTVASIALGESRVEVMPELTKQVNAYTTHNQIPWYKAIKEKIQVKVSAKLDNLVPLVRTTHGHYHHTLYRARFHSVKVLEGNFDSKNLMFYLERKFPTPESGIKLKELWPFHKGVVLAFKGNLVEGKLHILSIEKKTRR